MGIDLPINQELKTPDEIANQFGDNLSNLDIATKEGFRNAFGVNNPSEFTMPNKKINGVLNVGTVASTNDSKFMNVNERPRSDKEITDELKDYQNYIEAIRTELMHNINEVNETLLNDTPYALAFIDGNSVEIEICNEETHEMHMIDDEIKDKVPADVFMIQKLVSGYTFQMIQEYKNKQRDLVISALHDKYKTVARGIVTNHVDFMTMAVKDYVKIFNILSMIYEDFRPTYNTRNLGGTEIGTYDYDKGTFVTTTTNSKATL